MREREKEREKGREGSKIKDGGITPKNPNRKKVVFPIQIWKKQEKFSRLY